MTDELVLMLKFAITLNMNGRWQSQCRRGDQMSSRSFELLKPLAICLEWGVFLFYSASFLIVTFWREETDPNSRFFSIYVFRSLPFLLKLHCRLQCDVVLSILVGRYPKRDQIKQNMTFSRNTHLFCDDKIACEQRLYCWPNTLTWQKRQDFWRQK